MSQDVNLVVEKDNFALAKEIDDQQNQKLVSELKNSYLKKYAEYKEELKPKDPKNTYVILKNFLQYLWMNQQDLVKKLLLAEVFHDIRP